MSNFGVTDMYALSKKNWQHGCIKPREGGEGGKAPFIQCIKIIRFGREDRLPLGHLVAPLACPNRGGTIFNGASLTDPSHSTAGT